MQKMLGNKNTDNTQHELTSSLLDEFDTLVIGIMAVVAPVVPPVKVIQATARVGADTLIAPQAGHWKNKTYLFNSVHKREKWFNYTFTGTRERDVEVVEERPEW